MGKSVKKAVKKVTKVVKQAVKIAVKIAVVSTATTAGFLIGGYAGAAYGFNKAGGFQLGGEMLNQVGSALDDVGLDSASAELNRWSEDLSQVGKVLSGEYHKDMEAVEYARKKYEDELDRYTDAYNEAANTYNKGLNELLDKLEGLVAFHEIFKMAMSNRIEEYGEFTAPSDEKLTRLFAEYKKLADKLKKEYDFIISLQNGTFFEKIAHSMISVIGGLTRDMTMILTGEANSDSWKRIGQVVVAVVLVVVAILAAIPTGGASLSLIAVAGAVLATLSLLLMMDGMYAQGSLMGAIMESLDFLFNDVMQLNKLIGSDFEKFDADNEDYSEMQMYVQTAIALAAIALSVSSMFSGSTPGGASTGGGMANSASTTTGGSGAVEYTSVWSDLVASYSRSSTAVGISNLKDLYDIYSTASAVNDVIGANSAHKALKEQLNAKIEVVNDAIIQKVNMKMVESYKEVEYFLNDQQVIIDSYLYGATVENMYVDPYAITPVANIRFKPNKGEVTNSFGFEDVFNEDNQAGSKGYFNKLLYMK